jgi:hypothetical protein
LSLTRSARILQYRDLFIFQFAQMVLLTVKGTSIHDEFTFSVPAITVCTALPRQLAVIQNLRHRIRLQLYSAAELVEDATRANAALAPEFVAFKDACVARLKDVRTPVVPGDSETMWAALRDWAKRLFPADATHPDGDEAAVGALYEKHDNPDIDEAYRLHLYHVRAMLDPQYRPHEALKEDTAVLFFNGRELPSHCAIGALCAMNEKSRVTVKLGTAGGVAPSKEPRIGYDDQREMHARYAHKAAEFATLEESELRGRVLAQTRPGLALPSGGAAPSITTDAGRLRPIQGSVTERVSDAS